MTVQVRSGAKTDTAPITATVNPAPAADAAAVETGFGDLDGTLGPAEPTAPTFNMAADTGEDADVDLDARVAEPLPDKSTSDWNAVTGLHGPCCTVARVLRGRWLHQPALVLSGQENSDRRAKDQRPEGRQAL